MVYSNHAKISIISLRRQGFGPAAIARALNSRGLCITKQGVHKFIGHFRRYDTIERKEGSGRNTKFNAEMNKIVEAQMQKDDETTAHQLQRLLEKKGHSLHIRTILRARRQLGWTFVGSKYCQLIRNQNKLKRLHFAFLHQDLAFLEKCVFTDECTLQLESHKRKCYRKDGQKKKLKPKPKHPLKVHVWGGISILGAPLLCIFDGIMDKYLYVDILKNALLPFHQEHPDMWLQADNDPKHTSNYAKEELSKMGIVWFKTPPESPDMNPIENIWHEMKEFIRGRVKPKTKDQLVDGIRRFWKRRVTVEKCQKYIYHIKKVIPMVIEEQGDATGY